MRFDFIFGGGLRIVFRKLFLVYFIVIRKLELEKSIVNK